MSEFIHPCQILKAEPIEEGRVKIRIKASDESEDRVGEKVLKSAFADPSMQSNFVKDGYYDFNHLTDILDSKLAQASGSELVEIQKSRTDAIIGYPETLELQDDGVYSEGYLFAGNPFVERIRKSLSAGFKGWGASICGYTEKSNIRGKTITKINLRKIAIQPLQESINPNTSVQLLKSKGVVLLSDIDFSEDPESFTDNEPPVTNELSRLADRLDLILSMMIKRDDYMVEELARRIAQDIREGKAPAGFEGLSEFLCSKYGLSKIEAGELAANLVNMS